MLVSSGAAGAAGVYFYKSLPSTAHFKLRYSFQNARFFDAQGHLLYNMADLTKARGRRVVAPLQSLHDTGNPCRGGVNRIPLVLQNATIATEDATFYSNLGFDPLSIARAAYQDLTNHRIISGASTITQQVVRANFLNPADRSLTRKAKEVALAYEITKQFSKRTILWYYLNSVSYGNQAIGAQAAASIYFGTRVCQLDQAQAALLAGLPRGPSIYNPVRYRSRALVRMREVLGFMKLHGYLYSRAQIQRMMHEAQHWHFAPPAARMVYPQFVRYVINELKSMPKMRTQLYKGIDVYTTLNPQLQTMAQTTVAQQIAGLTSQHVTDGALVSLDLRPQHYGWILAMVGSANYASTTGQINMATTPRQPGSSMKPFNYIYAFVHGDVSPGTMVSDSPIVLPDPSNTDTHGWYMPTNYDHQFHGTVTLREALANSLNVPAVKVEYYLTGSNHVAQTAYRFGMKSIYKDNPGIACAVCYSVTLGGLAAGTRLLEETSAYGVFASTGVTVPPTGIWKIISRSTRRVLFCSAQCPKGSHPPAWLLKERKRVVDAAHAYEITSILSDNNARCTVQVCEFGLDSPLLLDRPAAAKTGTTNDWTDNWTVGYTPQIVTGVWVGNADRSPMQNVIGITGAAPIWHTFMENAFKTLKLPVATFVQPSNVVTSSLCTQPGTEYTSSMGEDLVVESTVPTTSAKPTTTPSATPYTYPSTFATTTLPTTIAYPFCSVPEKGSMPIACSDYPKPLPLGFECPSGYGYYTTTTGQTGFTTTPSTSGVQPQYGQTPYVATPTTGYYYGTNSP
jgi:membrane peptidoglycan carboxypeptidase